MGAAIDHLPTHRLRAKRVFGVFGLRRPAAQHTQAEGMLLAEYAAHARTLVEIGVAEGGSAAELREVMAHDGRLHLIDPYPRGRLGLSMMLVVARRTVGSVQNGSVRWLRKFSFEAVDGWSQPIDFLFIDGDHSFEGVSRDWRDWSPHVRVGGRVALHDARVFPQGWTRDDHGPVRLAATLEEDPRWRVAGVADSTVVLERVPD
jgi:predicted O-methyltransferase YrrM